MSKRSRIVTAAAMSVAGGAALIVGFFSESTALGVTGFMIFVTLVILEYSWWAEDKRR